MSAARNRIMEVMERENRSKAMILSILFHIAFFLFLYYYRFDAPRGDSEEQIVNGPIEIDFGGGGDDAQQGLPDAGNASIPSEPEPVSTPSEPTPSEAVPTPAPSKPVSSPPVATSEDPDVKALRLRQQAERAAEQERQQKEQQRLEALRAAEEAEKQRAAEKKKTFTGSFGNKKNSGTSGTPNGSGDNPSGVSSGSGGGAGGGSGGGVGTSIGGGIGNRKVQSRPSINYNTNDEGKVFVEVVVDQNGNVKRATVTGQSDPNANLQQIARKAALEFKFETASSPEQRGVITFNFKLKRAAQ